MTRIRCMRVLVVEDQKRTASFIRKALLAEGFAVDVAEDGETALQIADLTLDTVSRTARRGGRLIELSAREFRLPELLMRTPGRVCSRMLILEKVWDYSFDPGTNVV